VTLSIANHTASLPIAYRLYLPEAWANDRTRRKKAHIPEEIEFKKRSHRSRSIRSVRLMPQPSRRASCWRMRAMARTAAFASE